jgi:hypothetical protein
MTEWSCRANKLSMNVVVSSKGVDSIVLIFSEEVAGGFKLHPLVDKLTHGRGLT